MRISFLDIELTERCNNNCVHCYINQPEHCERAKTGELSTEGIKKIIKEAASLGCLWIKFTGGEPLLRGDFDDIYLFTRKLGLIVKLITNATLIDAERAKLFARIPPLIDIEVSLYGKKKESYEKVTKSPGAFIEAMKGINLLLKYEIPFTIRQAYLPPIKNEIEELISWSASIPQMKKKKPLFSMSFYLRCRHDSMKKNRIIKRLRPSPAETFAFLNKNENEYQQSIRNFIKKNHNIQGDILFSCDSGTRGGCVDAYGKFQICMLVRHPETVYDMKDGNLEDALMNFFPRIREIRATNIEYLRRCAKCFLKSFCGQCPGISWMEHGTLDTPVDYFCVKAHHIARSIGILDKDEWAWEWKNCEL